MARGAERGRWTATVRGRSVSVQDLPPLGGRLHLEHGEVWGHARIGGISYRITSERRGPSEWQLRFTPIQFSGNYETEDGGIKRLL